MGASDPGRPSGLHVATVGGVPVYLGWGWFVLAGVIMLLNVQANPGLGVQAYVVGAAWALSLLIAVLVHEGAHAFVARRLGLHVLRIVTGMFGGHTAYDGRTLRPGASAAIAAAGPAANLLLGGLAWLLAQPTTGMTRWLLDGAVWMNVLLGVFNLLPGLPLDGGAIVDALVWGVSGKRHLGLLAAGWVGRLLAVGIVLLAVVRPLLQGRQTATSTAIWTVLIALILWRGATAAIARGQARKVLARVSLADVATPAMVVPPDALIGDLPPGRAVLGLDERDRPLLVLGAVEGLTPQTPVSAGLIRLPEESLLPLQPDGDLLDVVLALQTAHAPVVLTSGGRPWGVVTREGLEAALAHAEAASGAN